MLVRYIACATILAGTVFSAAAQGRPDARAMTCDQVHSLLAARGGVVLTTGRHTYDRYVLSRAACGMGETAVPATIPTRDNARCPVRLCERYDPFFFLDPFD